MEFYATAVRLRTDINAWLLRDFGIKEKVRNLTITGKKHRMSNEDIKALSELLDRYGLGESILDSYPDWWIEQRRKTIDKRLADLMDCIVSANSIYAVSRQEYWERRLLHDKAISCVFSLIEELQFTISVLWRTTGVDVEKYMPYVEMCEKEIALLKGWRKADNKILQRLNKPKEG